MTAVYQPKNYRPEVDGLRSIAVLTVIFYHANIVPFSGGFVGVDIFFVISGYLITAILAKEMRGETFTFLNFYERRIRRILPALFFVTFVCMIAALFVSSPEQLKDFGQSIVATMVFSANIYFFLTSDYFSADVENLPFVHMWSLAVEEQFYVVFPILLLLVIKLRKKWLQLALIGAWITSLASSIYTQESSQIANFYLTPFRAWELLTGALIALNHSRFTAILDAAGRLRSVLELVGLACICFAVFFYTKFTPFPGWYAIPPVFGSALIIIAATERSLVGRILATKIAVGIGLLSYSAYLWHQPLFAFTRVYLAAEPSLWVYLLLIAITFLLSWFSWRFVEQPFRVKENFSRSQLFIFALSGSGIFAAAGLFLHLTNGIPQRFDAKTQAIASTMVPSPERNNCHTDGTDYLKPEKACWWSKGAKNWAVLGDSHAVEPSFALAKHLDSAGEGVVQLSFSGCPPALNFQIDNPGCHEWLNDAVKFLEQKPEIQNVMIVFRHSYHLFGDQLKTYPAFPDEHPAFLHDLDKQSARAKYMENYRLLVGRLVASGKKVYLVDPIPELPVLVERYVYNYANYSKNGGKPTGTPLSWYQERNRLILSEHTELAKSNAVFRIPVAPILCGEYLCRSIVEDKAMYFDDNHLSLLGARKLVESIADDRNQ
jgi:peptidoglycan/LPS O-acetylase OafA/YrhL